MTATDISEEINEPVVVDNLRGTYRPFGEYDPADYPDEVAGYRLELYGDDREPTTTDRLVINASSTEIINSGSDVVEITVDVEADSSGSWDGVLEIAGDTFEQTFSTTSTTTEEVVSTADAGEAIDVQARADGLADSETITIEVTD